MENNYQIQMCECCKRNPCIKCERNLNSDHKHVCYGCSSEVYR